MRTLVSTFVVGVCLVAAPAFAQQHPWVPSCVYTEGCMYQGSVPNGRAFIRSGDRLRTGKRYSSTTAPRGSAH
jgi:hypothetical protein